MYIVKRKYGRQTSYLTGFDENGAVCSHDKDKALTFGSECRASSTADLANQHTNWHDGGKIPYGMRFIAVYADDPYPHYLSDDDIEAMSRSEAISIAEESK